MVDRNRLSPSVVDHAASARHHCEPRKQAVVLQGTQQERSQTHKGPRVARGPGGRIKLNIQVGATIHSAASSWCGRTTDRNSDCLSN
jgi:hypothetical protein